jgi:hypothetical protein
MPAFVIDTRGSKLLRKQVVFATKNTKGHKKTLCPFVFFVAKNPAIEHEHDATATILFVPLCVLCGKKALALSTSTTLLPRTLCAPLCSLWQKSSGIEHKHDATATNFLCPFVFFVAKKLRH